MKVIELLTKIANGEEVPKRVLYNEETYSYVERNRLFAKYIKEPFNARIPYYLFTDVKNIYDEVEIIEDKPFNKRVEEIYKRHIDYICGEEDKKIEKITNMNCIDAIDSNCYEKYSNKAIALDINTLRHQINKIIDYINKEK